MTKEELNKKIEEYVKLRAQQNLPPFFEGLQVYLKFSNKEFQELKNNNVEIFEGLRETIKLILIDGALTNNYNVSFVKEHLNKIENEEIEIKVVSRTKTKPF